MVKVIALMVLSSLSLKAAADQANIDFEDATPGQSFSSQNPFWVTNHPDAIANISRGEKPPNQFLELQSPEGGLRTAKVYGPLRGKVKCSFDFNLQEGGFYVRWYESPLSPEAMQHNLGFDVLSGGKLRVAGETPTHFLGTISPGTWVRATASIEFKSGQKVGWDLTLTNLETGEEISLRNPTDLPASDLDRPPTEIGGMVFSAQREKGVKVLLDNVILAEEQDYPKKITNPAPQ